ncbi:MAG: LAGLIDADG family homing endonuclease [Candidatus Hodarchaeales archaeon]
MPRIFLILPSPQILENRHVQGLFDTDGHCHKTSSAVGVTTKSNRLVKDLKWFLKRRGIGGWKPF